MGGGREEEEGEGWLKKWKRKGDGREGRKRERDRER